MRTVNDTTMLDESGGGVRDALLIAVVYASLSVPLTVSIHVGWLASAAELVALATFGISTGWIARRSGRRWVVPTVATAGGAAALGHLWTMRLFLSPPAMAVADRFGPPSAMKFTIIHGDCFSSPPLLDTFLLPDLHLTEMALVAGGLAALAALPVGWVARRAWPDG